MITLWLNLRCRNLKYRQICERRNTSPTAFAIWEKGEDIDVWLLCEGFHTAFVPKSERKGWCLAKQLLIDIEDSRRTKEVTDLY